MMTKEKSPLRNQLKYLTILPLVFLIGLLLCCNTGKQELASPPPPPPPPPVDEQIESNVIADDDSAYVLVDEMAQFQGGSLEKFREWVQKNLVYPEVAIQNGMQGKITLQFAVNSKGKVCDLNIHRGVAPLLDNEAFRVINSSPEWIPAKIGGKMVKQQFVMPIIFSLQ